MAPPYGFCIVPTKRRIQKAFYPHLQKQDGERIILIKLNSVQENNLRSSGLYIAIGVFPMNIEVPILIDHCM